jgi:NAD-dependent dihydropyrimidine dehydrogenase PreA subunit
MKFFKKMFNKILSLFQSTVFNVIVLFLLTISITVISYTRVKSDIPATYPDIIPHIKGEFQFAPVQVNIRVSDTPITRRLLVFAYDEKGNQFLIVKPVYANTITVTQDDEADFKVFISTEGNIEGYQLVKGKGNSQARINFYRLLLTAQERGYHYGIQECFYPMEEKCVDVCPVKDMSLITFRVFEDGRIGPTIDTWRCPRSGLCIHYCPMGIIRNVAERIIKEGKEGNPHPTDVEGVSEKHQ